MPPRKVASQKNDVEARDTRTKKLVLQSDSEHEEEDDDLEKKIEKTMKKVMNEFKKDIRKEIKEQFKEVEKSLDFMSNHLDKVLGEMKEIKQCQQKLERENREMKEQMKKMAEENEGLQQYTRIRNIQIDGVPVENDENLEDVMLEIGKKINVNIKKEEIDAIHRIPTRIKKNTEPIIVQFVTRKLRESVLKNAKANRITTKDLKATWQERPIFINEHLTPQRKQLMYEARKIKEEKGYKFLWTKGGKIFIRKDENSRTIQLYSLEDLDKIQ
uniref:FP protein C-terminal domain-containing protein n=1 Tax=Cacopsylla melanoneura TaxID=428564 RepID=A0A8D8YTP8_9HEMI